MSFSVESILAAKKPGDLDREPGSPGLDDDESGKRKIPWFRSIYLKWILFLQNAKFKKDTTKYNKKQKNCQPTEMAEWF